MLQRASKGEANDFCDARQFHLMDDAEQLNSPRSPAITAP